MSIDLDLRHYLSIIRKRVWLLIAIVILSTTVTGVVSYKYLQPVYQAYTKLIVNSANDKPGMVQLDLNAINTNISLINTYKEIIRTPAIMDKVVAQHPEFKVTTDELMRNINFTSVNGTQVVTLSYPSTNYKAAARIVNAISEVFQAQIPNIMKVDNVYLLHMANENKQPAPIKPNPKLNMAIMFVLSFMFGIGLVLLLDYFDDRIKSEADVERYLGLPTLVQIPSIRQVDLRGAQKTKTTAKAGEQSRAAN
ncbi:lipopolysaccharide biosynthesis protein [Paenibacillus rhizovicinus]|uniref:Lipopolysaccharide biosynthesis protein n=1 Tax=Paenibacillus rhizovicinus TaxID=2704463 RepID=A0A6C0P777_9BACL|nr:Wzz/FepE/Etk N-terminal domain-containing protein [Paenibacillus rhizovicinus]QHW34309.1 lipopolysaccharide biosynthesis protein [Paenibacillus rhizovicinus]